MLNHIVVVDDSEAIRLVLESELKALGVNLVKSFSDAREALGYVKGVSTPIDGVLTDLQMPFMDGLEFIEALGKQRFRGGVVMISGMEERVVKLAVDIALSYQVCLVGSVEKPVERDKLAQQLSRIVQLQGDEPKEIKYLKRRELMDKIRQDKIIAYYQPKVNLHTSELVGLEVLCRIDDPAQQGIIPPDRFIPVAEKFDLADDLTKKVLERSLKEFKLFRDEFPDANVSLAINISPNQLYSDALPHFICDMCERYGVSREKLVVEITERQVITDQRQLANLDRLRLKGFGVSLDDFGSGFTNIRQIKNYPFTEIKLDQAIVQNISTDRISQVILDALAEIAGEYDATVVAEGIETIEDYFYMQKQPGIVAQGYLISRPKPIQELIRWYHAWLKKQSGVGSQTSL